MSYWTGNDWAIMVCVFLIGLFIGMFLLAGGKWKRRYREEYARREELERDNARLSTEAREMTTLRERAARTPSRTDPDRPL